MMTIRWMRAAIAQSPAGQEPPAGEGKLLAMDEKTVTFLSTHPHPPGARVEGMLRTATGQEVSVKFKSHGSKVREDGLFVIIGRPVDQTREAREALRGTLPPG